MMGIRGLRRATVDLSGKPPRVLGLDPKEIVADANGNLYYDTRYRASLGGYLGYGPYEVVEQDGKFYIDSSQVKEPSFVHSRWVIAIFGWLMGLVPLYELERDVDAHEP